MENANETRKSKIKTWANTIFIVGFLCIWVSGMTAGLMARACRNDRYEGAEKLRFCNISLTAGAWTEFSDVERAKRSRIKLERGIALFQMGELDKAAEAFDVALRDARIGRGSREQELTRRMVELDDLQMLGLWFSVVDAAE